MNGLLDINGVKNPIETVHMNFLCKNFSLEKITKDFLISGFQPDLIDFQWNALYELKTANYPKINSKNRGQSQYGWWSLSTEQISNYDMASEISGMDLYWIFILGHTNAELTSYKQISENIIFSRDIYVLPWNVHKKFNMTNARMKNIGKNKMMPKIVDYIPIYDEDTNKLANLYLDSKLPEKIKEVFLL